MRSTGEELQTGEPTLGAAPGIGTSREQQQHRFGRLRLGSRAVILSLGLPLAVGGSAHTQSVEHIGQAIAVSSTVSGDRLPHQVPHGKRAVTYQRASELALSGHISMGWPKPGGVTQAPENDLVTNTNTVSPNDGNVIDENVVGGNDGETVYSSSRY